MISDLRQYAKELEDLVEILLNDALCHEVAERTIFRIHNAGPDGPGAHDFELCQPVWYAMETDVHGHTRILEMTLKFKVKGPKGKDKKDFYTENWKNPRPKTFIPATNLSENSAEGWD